MLLAVLRNLGFTASQFVVTLEFVKKYHSPAPMIRTWRLVLDLGSAMVEEILFKDLFPSRCIIGTPRFGTMLRSVLEHRSKNAVERRKGSIQVREIVDTSESCED